MVTCSIMVTYDSMVGIHLLMWVTCENMVGIYLVVVTCGIMDCIHLFMYGYLYY